MNGPEGNHMDFELRPQRIMDRRKVKNNVVIPSQQIEAQQRLNVKEVSSATDQLHETRRNLNPFDIVFESNCKLHRPSSQSAANYSISSQFDPIPDSYKYNNVCYNVEGPGVCNYQSGGGHGGSDRSGFCVNDGFYGKQNGSPMCIPTPPPPFSRPSSPKVYFKKTTNPIIPQNGSGANPHIIRPTSQGTIPTSDINCNAPTQAPKVVEMDIFLKNQVVVKLEVANGQLATCRDLIHLILEEPEVGIPKEAEDLFALWLVSPLFEVQLKPDHKPYQIWKKWPELLSKYTSVNLSQREKDQPFLSFQRDVFYPRREEVRLATLTVLELLYEEAKTNVLNGRYPCDQNTVEKMAGMQARIELGKFDPEIHTPAFMKSKMESFLPSYACKPKWSFFNFGSKSGLEYRIWLQFRTASDDLSVHTVMKQYLDLCWNLPFYGSAFFVGQLEKPVTGLAALIGYQDLPVTIAVNAEGVNILSQGTGDLSKQVLLGLRYQELSWDSARPAQENNPDCFPCLFLQFQTLEGGQRVFKVLQVFSKQAILMDAIISSFVRALRQRSWDHDEVDDNSAATPGECTPDADDVQTPLTTNSLYGSNCNDSDACLNSKLQRLSLATFNEDGVVSPSFYNSSRKSIISRTLRRKKPTANA